MTISRHMDKIIMLKDEIKNEAGRIEEDAIHSAKGHFNAAAGWKRVHYWIGIPATIFAAIAGASALSQFSYHAAIAGTLSIIVAALSAISTFINPNQKSEMHHSAGTSFNSVKNRARIFHKIELQQLDEKSATQELNKLSAERDELNKKSPQIPNKAFRKAREGVSQGEATYQVDK